MSDPARYDPAALEARAREVLASDLVTAPTRAALLERLEAPAGEGVLDADALRALAAAAARLIPLGALGEALDLGRRFDATLASGPGDGWRYADMPADVEAHRLGLRALDAAARSQAGVAFAEQDGAGQDAVLAAVQAGSPPGPPWPLSPARWFEELLAALTELAYADVRVQLAIGYDGFADADGWQGGSLQPAGRG